MKKILSVALVALLATSAVFAGFTGSASLGLGYNFEKKSYGFSNSNSTKIKIDSEYLSESVEIAGEGAIYAGLKASFTITAKAADSGVTFKVDPNAVAEAYITNDAWKVSILSAVKNGPDYAKSAIDTYYDAVAKKDKAVTYQAPYAVAPGLTASYNGWTASVDFAGKEKVVDYSATIETPEFDFDGLKVKAAAVVSEKNTAAVDAGKDSYYLNTETGAIEKNAGSAAVAAKQTVAAGASVKASYAVEGGISANVAADFGFENLKSDVVAINFDAAANVAYAPVTADVYFNWNAIAAQKAPAKLLSAKVAADLAAYEIPVSVALTGKNLLAEARTLTASAKATVGALTVDGSVTLAALKDVSYGVKADYTYTADIFTAKAGIGYNFVNKDSQQLYASASVSSDVLVPGATLSLAYAPIKDDKGNVTSNILAEKYGKVDATCKITF